MNYLIDSYFWWFEISQLLSNVFKLKFFLKIRNLEKKYILQKNYWNKSSSTKSLFKNIEYMRTKNEYEYNKTI